MIFPSDIQLKSTLNKANSRLNHSVTHSRTNPLIIPVFPISIVTRSLPGTDQNHSLCPHCCENPMTLAVNKPLNDDTNAARNCTEPTELVITTFPNDKIKTFASAMNNKGFFSNPSARFNSPRLIWFAFFPGWQMEPFYWIIKKYVATCLGICAQIESSDGRDGKQHKKVELKIMQKGIVRGVKLV